MLLSAAKKSEILVYYHIMVAVVTNYIKKVFCVFSSGWQNKRKFAPFYLPKLAVVGLIWISAVTLATWQSYNLLTDPTYDYRIDTGNFLVG